MVSSVSFINWNLVLEGMKPVFCLIILAVCIADSHFILECGIHYIGDFPGGSGIKKNPPANQETWVRFLGQEDPLEKEMATHSSILAWKNPTDRGAWQIVHGVAKGLDTT